MPSPTNPDIERRVKALPLVEGGEILDEATGLLVHHLLAGTNAVFIQHLDSQIDAIDQETGDTLEKLDPTHYTVSKIELRGVIARAAIAGSSQAAFDLGRLYAEIYDLEQSVFPNDAIDDSA